jgi:excisionase family DNA binding protein
MTSKAHPPYGYSGSPEAAPAPEPRDDRLLTIIEVARMLRLHRNSVRNLIRCGDLSSVRVPHRIRVPAADVIRYLERHQSTIGTRPRSHSILQGIHRKRRSRARQQAAGSRRLRKSQGHESRGVQEPSRA